MTETHASSDPHPRSPAPRPSRELGELQTLKRGLAALAFLNANGCTTLAALARELDVPRPTAYRILQTLTAEGYCNRIPNSRLYLITPQVRRLSAGLGEGELLTNVAIPIIQALSHEIMWPLAVATPRGGDMLVRLTTDRATPLALTKINPGSVTPMLMTTTGMLCLAFAPEEVRDHLIEAALEGRDIHQFFHNRAQFDQLIIDCRQTGYMLLNTRHAEGCVGVPIMRDGRPLGGLVMRYIKSAMPQERVIEVFLPKLLAARDQIQADFEAAIG